MTEQSTPSPGTPPSTKKETPRIIVLISAGVVESIHSNIPNRIKVSVVDQDMYACVNTETREHSLECLEHSIQEVVDYNKAYEEAKTLKKVW